MLEQSESNSENRIIGYLQRLICHIDNFGAEVSNDERTKIRQLIIKVLKKSGIEVAENASAADLIQEFKTWDQQQAELNSAKYDYGNFCQANPPFVLGENVLIKTSRQPTPSHKINYIHEGSAQNSPISFIRAPYKGKDEDAIGISTKHDRYNFVVADGVTKCLVARIASRIAAQNSLKYMKNMLLSEDEESSIFLYIFNELQNQPVIAIARNELVKHGKAPNDCFASGILAATTLTTVQYFPKSNEISIAAIGDSPVVIFPKNTGYKDKARTPSDFSCIKHSFYLEEEYEADPELELTEKLTLKPDDVFLISSDGLNPQYYPLITHALEKAAHNKPNYRLDWIVKDVIKDILLKGGAHDDLSVIIVQHI